jgi:hypothetical protein
MNQQRGADPRIAAYFKTAQPDLPDRTFDAVREEIHRTGQVVALGPLRLPTMPRFAAYLVTAAMVIAVGALALVPRQGLVPGGPSSPVPSSATSATPPVGPTRFNSTIYGYSVTIPAGWIAAAAFIPWDGTRQPGPDADVDKFAGPGQLSAFGFAGPFEGGLAAFVTDRIAANARDHADTCPHRRPDINEPLQIGGRRWVLLGWNCGVLINQALTVRAGIAYAFTFRDLGVDGATDPADRALFESILDSVQLPS